MVKANRKKLTQCGNALSGLAWRRNSCLYPWIWRYFRSSVMITRWRYCHGAAMITRLHQRLHYWGQPSIDFPIGDHVNVSRCRSHTNASGVISTSHIVASHITKPLLSFSQILQFRFRDNPQGRIPPWKVTKTRPFLSTCYGDPSATEVPPYCEAATTKLTFSTTSVLLLLNMPLSLYRGTIFRLQKNPRRGYCPKIAGILFVSNEPEGKYYTVPYYVNAVMITRWRYWHNATTITRWQQCLSAAMITRWHYCISEEMVTGWVYWIVNVSNCKELLIARRKHQHLQTSGNDPN